MKPTLDDETYDDVREKTGGFNGGLVQAARNKAAEASKSVVARWKNGKKASKPTFTSPHVVYDKRTATFHEDYVSLATTDGRIEADYVLPDKDSDTPHSEYLFSDEYETTGAELHYHGGNWVLHVHCKKDVESDAPEQATPENGTVLGVDLGIENLAVTSTAHFVSGRELTHNLREFENVRAGLQQTGTRSAHRTLEQSTGRELRYVRDVLHRASNAIVDEALRYECDVIAFEDMTHIRDRTGASWGHKWAFRTLYEQVEYKAEAVGISVKQVGAAYTSKRCAECGFTADENRATRNDFRCVKCESEANADYNAVVGFHPTGSKVA